MTATSKAASVWQKLSNLVSREDLTTEDLCNNENLHLSVAALLIHVATADDDFDIKEEKIIRALLIDQFELPYDVVTRLLSEAHQQTEESLDLYRFVRIINRNLDQEGRKDIVRMLWHVVFIDEKIKHWEDVMMRKICHLLGVVWHDSVELKEEAYETKMWQKITDFMSRDDIGYSDLSVDQNLHIASAALFLHAALADEEFHEKEFEKITIMIKDRFQYEDALIEQLITHANRTRNEQLNVDAFIQIVNDNLGSDEIKNFFRMIWEIIIADGKIHPFEQHLANMLAPNFNIGPMEHEEIKNSVVGESTEFKSNIQKIIEDDA